MDITMKKFISGQEGLSALAMTMGAAIAAGVAIGGATLMKNLGSSSKGNDVRQEIQSYTDEISKTLNHKVACRKSLIGAVAASGDVLTIKDSDGNPKYSVGDVIGINRIKIVSMKLQDLPGLDDTVEIIPGDEGSTRLEIKFAQDKEGSVEIRKTINMFVQTEGSLATTATIRECYASVGGSGSFWIKEKTNPLNIFYNEGFVGMGVDNPNFPLDVGGTIAVTNGGDLIELGGNASQFELRVSDVSKPVEFLNAATSGFADIKAGNIKAGSYIKLATTGDCDSASTGSIKYNSSTKQVEICEGGSWVAKQYEEWCVPVRKRKEQDDNAMWFHQSDNARREKGTGCDRVQIDGRADNTGFSDLKIGSPDYGHRIRHDHSNDPCTNDQLCQTYRDVDQ